jgi:hypothetical protein
MWEDPEFTEHVAKANTAAGGQHGRRKRDIPLATHVNVGKMVGKLPSAGCYVTFSVEKDMNAKAFLFDVGTRVQEDDLAHLEIHEERESGRRAIRKKTKMERTQKKGDLAGKKKRPAKVGGKENDEKAGGKGEEAEKNGAKEEVETPNEAESVKKTTQWEEITEEADEVEKESEKINEEEDEGKRGGEEEGKEAKKKDGEDDDDEDDDDDEETTKLITYAILLAIQKGRKGFGQKPFLNYANLPAADEDVDMRVMEKALTSIDKMIAACDGSEEDAATGPSKVTQTDG